MAINTVYLYTVYMNYIDKKSARFSIIEHYLVFWGELRRAHLIKHFDIGTVSASRLISAYGDVYPTNLSYNVKRKTYVYDPELFKPAFSLEPEFALQLLSTGETIHSVPSHTYGPKQHQQRTLNVDINACAGITRAIVQSQSINVVYVSATSGEKTRRLTPISLFNGNGAWYFRAYDGHSKSFRTFKFNRVVSVDTTSTKPSTRHIEEDDEWNASVVLSLAPHTQHPNKQALALDLGLSDKPVFNVISNSVTAGYILQELRVDCSARATLNPLEYNYQLMNYDECKEHAFMELAPT